MKKFPDFRKRIHKRSLYLKDLVAKDTCLLSIMSASNISGNIIDIETIVKKAREIKPDLYIISDAVRMHRTTV